jgi:hypothetical protein
VAAASRYGATAGIAETIGRRLEDEQAVIDYVSTFGCKRDEIVTIGVDTVAWRGVHFSGVPAPPEPRQSRRVCSRLSREASRGDRDRTCDLWFWRPCRRT